MTRRIIACLLGVFLLGAAGLNLSGMNVAPFAQYGRLSSAEVQLAVVEWEVVLGIWLLSGRGKVGAWFASVLTFLAFASVSFYLGVIGQASCGCFGAVKASPWHAFVLDVGIFILLLAFGRPAATDWVPAHGEPLRQVVRREFGLLGGVAGCVVALVGVAFLAFGSPGAALAYLRNERVTVRPTLLDVGSGQAGEIVRATVEVVNWSDRPVIVYGGTSDCSCVTTADLPVTLSPREAQRVVVSVRLPEGTRGLFSRKAFFRTDCDEARIVSFGLTGKINSPAGASARGFGGKDNVVASVP